MQRVAPWTLVFMVVACVAAPLAAEPRSAAPAATPSTDEERAFDADARRYQRLAEFTQRLVREREQRAFDEAVERYQRFSKLTEKLAEQAAAAAERELDAEVELYLRKAALTRELAGRGLNSERASSTGASAPVW